LFDRIKDTKDFERNYGSIKHSATIALEPSHNRALASVFPLALGRLFIRTFDVDESSNWNLDGAPLTIGISDLDTNNEKRWDFSTQSNSTG
jgi:hypothetical protein